MIVVDITGINSNIKSLTKNITDFTVNYNDYYTKTENTSNSWVGMIATKFFDAQLENKTLNKKIIDNVQKYENLMSYIVNCYSEVSSKKIKIELSKKETIENKYRDIDSSLRFAYDELGNVNNISVSSAQGKISTARNKLEGAKGRTVTLFEKVNGYESRISTKVSSMQIGKVEELNINPYMVN